MMFARSLRTISSRSSISLRRTWTSLTRTDESLTVHALDGTTFPYVWLRDSCQSPKCVNPATGHKLHRTSDIPLDIAPVEGDKGIQVTQNGLQIMWNDGQRSVFEKAWLERYGSTVARDKYHRNDLLKPQLWNRESIAPLSTLSFGYEELQRGDGRLGKALEELFRYGIVFVRGVPNEETSDEKCELWKVAKMFGDLRNTFYGEVWDVVKLKDGNNVGYTDLPLALHMDLLFYEHPPQYQILHCLRHKAIGGSNFVVDGFYAAEVLRERHPREFEVLTKTPVPFQYIHDGRHAIQEHFTIGLKPAKGKDGSRQEISHVNYSPHEQGPLPLSTPKEFYGALKLFAELLEDEKQTVRFNLEEGDAVLWDNRRIVHGRTGFRSRTEEEWETSGLVKTKPGEPDRWLKGCYLGADAVLDRVRALAK